MKKLILTILFSGVYLLLNSQTDRVIFLQSGDQLEFSKIRAKKEQLQYQATRRGETHFLDYDDIHFIVNKKNVQIPYKYRDMDLLKAGPLVIEFSEIDPQSSCTNGMLDAINNVNHTGGAVGGFVTGVFAPIGLVGTAIIASKPPLEHNMNFTQETPLDDNLYMDCYRQTAKKQKSRTTWLSAASGFSITIAIATLVTTLATM